MPYNSQCLYPHCSLLHWTVVFPLLTNIFIVTFCSVLLGDWLNTSIAVIVSIANWDSMFCHIILHIWEMYFYALERGMGIGGNTCFFTDMMEWEEMDEKKTRNHWASVALKKLTNVFMTWKSSAYWHRQSLRLMAMTKMGKDQCSLSKVWGERKRLVIIEHKHWAMYPTTMMRQYWLTGPILHYIAVFW